MGILAGGLAHWALAAVLASPSQETVGELWCRTQDVLAQSPPTAAHIYRFGQEVQQGLERGAGEFERDTALAIIDAIQAALRARIPKEGLIAERYAADFAWGAAYAARSAGQIEFAAEVLAREARTAPPDEPLLPYLWLELATTRRMQAHYPEAREALQAALEVLVPAGIDPSQHEPHDYEAAAYLASWFDVAGTLELHLGNLELAQVYVDELGRRAEALDNSALRFAALNNGMRLALVAQAPEQTLRLSAKARASAWRESIGAPFLAQLDLLEAWATLLLEERSTQPNDQTLDVEGRFAAVLDSQHSTLHERHAARLGLAMHLLLRQDALGARRQLEALGAPASSGSSFERAVTQGELALLELGLKLRCSRLLDAPDRVESVAAVVASAHSRLLQEWRSQKQTASYGAYSGVHDRNLMLTELLKTALQRSAGQAGVERAFEIWLQTEAASYDRIPQWAARDQSPGASLAELRSELVRQNLHTEIGFLVLVPSRFESCLLWFDGTACGFELLPAFHELERTAVELDRAALKAYESASAQAHAAFRQRVAEATAQFLPRTAAAFVAQHAELVIVGAENLAWPSFELLELEPGEPLGLNCALTYSPSLSTFADLAARWDSSMENRAGAFVLAAPTLGSTGEAMQLPALPYGASERRWTARMMSALDPERGQCLSGSQATVQAYRECERALVTACVTHAVHDPRRQSPPGLLLASDDSDDAMILWGEELSQVPAAPITLVACCKTGLAHPRRYDSGGAHLGTSLIRAGGVGVLLNTTDIEYAVSLELSARLLEHLRVGATLAEALRQARVGTIGADGADRAGSSIQALLPKLYGLGSRALPETHRAASVSSQTGRRSSSNPPPWMRRGLFAATFLLVVSGGLYAVWRARRARGRLRS